MRQARARSPVIAAAREQPPVPAAGGASEARSVAALRWWRGWLPLVVMPPAAILLVPPAWPRWALMWTLAFALFCGCKWLTWRRTPIRGVAIWRHVGYLAAWPGLDAAGFLDARTARVPARPAAREWLYAGCKLAVGVALLYGAARWVPSQHPCVVGWVGMVGIVMILHFGTFHLLSCAWRTAGVDARPLMNRPLAAASVSDFWGRRWNTAFRDLTHRFLFRPLAARLGGSVAVLAGFIFSGVVHDVVISLPARGGYGGPTFFFLLQAIGILFERSRVGRRLGLGAGARGWVFTMAIVIAPATILFHRPFVTGIIVPFLRAVGAL